LIFKEKSSIDKEGEENKSIVEGGSSITLSK
jgi:hypothetical protein